MAKESSKGIATSWQNVKTAACERNNIRDRSIRQYAETRNRKTTLLKRLTWLKASSLDNV